VSSGQDLTIKTSKLRGPVEEIPGLSSYLAGIYLPLAGGTVTGELFIASGAALYLYDPSADADVQISVDDGELLVGTSIVLDINSTLDASKLGVGTVPDARLSSNVPRLNAANTGTLNVSGRTTVGSLASPTSELPIFQSGADRANFSNGTLVVTTFLGLCASNPAAPDVFFRRNATGPTAETRAAGGLKVCNADGSAVGPVECSTITAPNQLVASYQSPQFKMSGYATGVSLWGNTDVGIISNGVGVASYKFNTGMLVKSNLHIGWSSLDVNGAASTTLSQASAGVLQVGTTSNNALGSLNLANLTASGSIRPGQFTVATLPSAAANTGRTVQVTDSSVDFPGNIGNTVVGGGANNVDVKSNGTNWRITG